MDVDREHLDGGLVESLRPGRHAAVARVGDRLDNRLLLAAVEPDTVVELLGADLDIALALVAVAGGAILREDLGAAARRHGIGGLPGEGQHVFRDVVDLLGLEDVVDAEARHRRLTRARIRVADAEGDRLVDVVEIAAPKPIVIGEIGEALRPGAAWAMAGYAVVRESRVSAGDREV